MDQHPITRQITTFEFKLIGFLTIKQFIYLVIFVALGLLVYGLTPVPVLNVIFGIIVACIGAAFAFIPINDRPMEVWIRNLIKRLTSPTQYGFQKHNKPISVLQNVTYGSNPQQVAIHVDSQQNLNSYLSSKNPRSMSTDKKQSINNLLSNPLSFFTKKTAVQPTVKSSVVARTPTTVSAKHPFLTGSIKNHNQTPLGSILIYVKKTSEGEPIRILKSNAHGIFLSYNPLPQGEYFFEAKDPKKAYFFDTIKLKIENINNNPIELKSKELI